MSKLKSMKQLFKNASWSWSVYAYVHTHLTGGNRKSLRGKGNSIQYHTSLLQNTRFVIQGNRNQVIFGDKSRLANTLIFIQGDDNIVEIGSECNIRKTHFWIEDNNNVIALGNHVTIQANAEVACIEGCKIIIGHDCMFSSDVTIRTGDSHSIIDADGARINQSKDVTIGDHVWIGHKAVLNKGAMVGSNSIVGANSLVTKAFQDGNSILAGSPASVIKTGVNWKRERI